MQQKQHQLKHISSLLQRPQVSAHLKYILRLGSLVSQLHYTYVFTIERNKNTFLARIQHNSKFNIL